MPMRSIPTPYAFGLNRVYTDSQTVNVALGKYLFTFLFKSVNGSGTYIGSCYEIYSSQCR